MFHNCFNWSILCFICGTVPQISWHTESRWRLSWHKLMGHWLVAAVVVVRAPAGLWDFPLIHATLMLQKIIFSCGVLRKSSGNLQFVSALMHPYTPNDERMVFTCSIFFSPYGQPCSWPGVPFKCVPPPSAPPSEPTLFLIIGSKSRTPKALNIRPLCCVINSITRTNA